MKFILIPILFFSSYVSLAQTSNEEKIAQVYGETMAAMSPEQINWVNNCLARCQVIAAHEAPEGVKEITNVQLNNKYGTVTPDDSYNEDTFNPLKYSFDFFKKEDQYFTLFNSGKVLKIKGKE